MHSPWFAGDGFVNTMTASVSAAQAEAKRQREVEQAKHGPSWLCLNIHDTYSPWGISPEIRTSGSSCDIRSVVFRWLELRHFGVQE